MTPDVRRRLVGRAPTHLPCLSALHAFRSAGKRREVCATEAARRPYVPSLPRAPRPCSAPIPASRRQDCGPGRPSSARQDCRPGDVQRPATTRTLTRRWSSRREMPRRRQQESDASISPYPSSHIHRGHGARSGARFQCFVPARSDRLRQCKGPAPERRQPPHKFCRASQRFARATICVGLTKRRAMTSQTSVVTM